MTLPTPGTSRDEWTVLGAFESYPTTRPALKGTGSSGRVLLGAVEPDRRPGRVELLRVAYPPFPQSLESSSKHVSCRRCLLRWTAR
jgi:hypothetical protein